LPKRRGKPRLRTIVECFLGCIVQRTHIQESWRGVFWNHVFRLPHTLEPGTCLNLLLCRWGRCFYRRSLLCFLLT
jgi:hypothetical protein